MRYTIPFFYIFLFACLLLSSCTSGGNKSFEGGDMGFGETSSMNRKQQPASKEESDQTGEMERKIIKEGRLRFPAADLKKMYAHISESVNRLGGYISNEESFDYSNRIEYQLQVRIPSVHFDSLISLISKEAGKIDEKQINLQDVTEQYIDLDSRLKTKKEFEKRYLELLEKAGKVEELLAIEKQLAELREDIEATEGRLLYLNNQVSLSKLQVNFYKEKGKPFVTKVKSGFKDGWDGFLGFLVGLVTIWPFILLILLVIWLIVRWNRRKKIYHS